MRAMLSESKVTETCGPGRQVPLRRAVAVLPVRKRDAGRRMAAASKSREGETLAAAELVPEHLLDGGEIVLFAIKPSLWFILFASIRWLICLGAIMVMLPWFSSTLSRGSSTLVAKAALVLVAARLCFAVLEWASRLYVLTNRRVMRIRGIFNINLFECSLLKIQNTDVTLSWYQRLFGLGTVAFATAGTGPFEVSWPHVAHPLEVHEQVRAAINRARGLGC
jgi:hypothetical protein